MLDTANDPTWEYTPTQNQLVVPGLTGPNFYIFGPIVHTGPHPIEIEDYLVERTGYLGEGEQRKHFKMGAVEPARS